MARPERSEFADYYLPYVDKVTGDNIAETLAAQPAELQALLSGVDDSRSRYRYAPDKWTLRQVIGHINDCERLFIFRAFWFARALDSSLPSFDQNAAMLTAGSDDRPLTDHVAEFTALRESTVMFVKNLPAEAWDRRNVASGNPFTVRALLFVAAGHVEHHLRLIRERYLASS